MKQIRNKHGNEKKWIKMKTETETETKAKNKR